MTSWRQLRQIPESILVGLALIVVPPLPRTWVVSLARCLGTLGYFFSGHLRATALANLELAFGGTLTAREKKAIARESFQTFSLVLLDLFWFSFRTRRRIARYVRFDSTADAYFATRPAIAVTAHLGNWEVMGTAAALKGHPSVSVVAPFENPVVDAFLRHVRRKTGQEVAEKEGAVKTLLRTLRNGGRVALVMDQNTLPMDGGEFVPFFGMPVPMSKAAATLALKTGAAIFPGFTRPVAGGCYECHVLGRLEPEGADAVDLTRRIARSIEEAVREHPGHWLWTYKRWKYVPEGEDRSRYPFYSKPARGRAAEGGPKA